MARGLPNNSMQRTALRATADAERCADARACRRASRNDSGRRDDTLRARRCTAASQRRAGAWRSAHRGGG